MPSSGTSEHGPRLPIVFAIAAVVLFQGSHACATKSLGGTQFFLFDRPPMANDLRMATLDGRTFSLSELKGKVVLLNFWRRNCPFCVHEKRYLKDMMKRVGRSDLEALCVNLWDSPSWISRRYGTEKGRELVYATRPDDRASVIENTVRGRLMGYYVVNGANEAIYEIKGFPSTYVIDKKGRVVASHMGMVNWTKPSVRNWLLELLGPDRAERPGQAEEYVLPDWIDRLLTNDVYSGRMLQQGPHREAHLAPSRRASANTLPTPVGRAK